MDQFPTAITALKDWIDKNAYVHFPVEVGFGAAGCLIVSTFRLLLRVIARGGVQFITIRSVSGGGAKKWIERGELHPDSKYLFVLVRAIWT